MALTAFFCSYFMNSWLNSTTKSVSWNQPRQWSLHKTTQEIKTTHFYGDSTQRFSLISLCQHWTALTALWTHRALGAWAGRSDLTIAGPSRQRCSILKGFCPHCRCVYSLQPLHLQQLRIGAKFTLKHGAKDHLSCNLLMRCPCQDPTAWGRNSVVPMWCCNSMYNIGQYRLMLSPYPLHFQPSFSGLYISLVWHKHSSQSEADEGLKQTFEVLLHQNGSFFWHTSAQMLMLSLGLFWKQLM